MIKTNYFKFLLTNFNRVYYRIFIYTSNLLFSSNTFDNLVFLSSIINTLKVNKIFSEDIKLKDNIDYLLFPLIANNIKSQFDVNVTSNVKEVLSLTELVGNLDANLLAAVQYFNKDFKKTVVDAVYNTIIPEDIRKGGNEYITKVIQHCSKICQDAEDYKDPSRRSRLEQIFSNFIQGKASSESFPEEGEYAACLRKAVIRYTKTTLAQKFFKNAQDLLNTPEKIYAAKGFNFWQGSGFPSVNIDGSFSLYGVLGFPVEKVTDKTIVSLEDLGITKDKFNLFKTLFDIVMSEDIIEVSSSNDNTNYRLWIYQQIVRALIMRIFVIPSLRLQQSKFLPYKFTVYAFIDFSYNALFNDDKRVYKRIPIAYLYTYAENLKINAKNESSQPFGIPLDYELSGSPVDVAYGIIRILDNISLNLIAKNTWDMLSSFKQGVDRTYETGAKLVESYAGPLVGSSKFMFSPILDIHGKEISYKNDLVPYIRQTFDFNFIRKDRGFSAEGKKASLTAQKRRIVKENIGPFICTVTPSKK